MALVMALIVIVLMTLLVAGAITFTGTERDATALQTREDSMSACAQAARNLFISRLRVLLGNAEGISFSQPINELGGVVRTGHFNGSVGLKDVQYVTPNAIGESRGGAIDMTNKVGTSALVAGYYLVTATCQENNNINPATRSEREIEFVVRVGL
jgi:hypothetical protein